MSTTKRSKRGDEAVTEALPRVRAARQALASVRSRDFPPAERLPVLLYVERLLEQVEEWLVP